MMCCCSTSRACTPASSGPSRSTRSDSPSRESDPVLGLCRRRLRPRRRDSSRSWWRSSEAVREEAKAAGDGALSQAVKIQMNSLYGVLGTGACRFYDSRLATSITRRGHEIIQKSRDFIEARDHSVIYGDTDSLFLLLSTRGAAKATRSAAGGGARPCAQRLVARRDRPGASPRIVSRSRVRDPLPAISHAHRAR